MSKSIERVRKAAAEAGLEIDVRRMGESTRTAEEAAAQCGVGVAQIVKSLVFRGKGSGRLYLFLVSGANRLDAVKAAAAAGEELDRADPRQVTLFDSVGFAIEDFSALRYVHDRIKGTALYTPLDLLADPDEPRDLYGMLLRAAA